MKFSVNIDKSREEEIVVFAHERSRLVDEIEQLVSDNAFDLTGYSEKEAVTLSAADIHCFTVEDNKIYALTETQKYLVKIRLYRLEEALSDNFVKINQSCLANVSHIARFDASLSGSLLVIFKNGYSDYVSRRNLKKVKERFGL